MKRTRLLWLAAFVAVAVLVAIQTVVSSSERTAQFIARADIPTVAPGVDVLAGIAQIPARIRSYDYRRDAFSDTWTTDNSAPGGRNGCDTRFREGFDVLGKTRQEVKSKPGTLR